MGYLTALARVYLSGHLNYSDWNVSDPEMRDQELHTSLFEHLLNVYGDDLAQTLHRQFRMHVDIAAFASQEFYDGNLEHGEANRVETIDGLTPLLGIVDSGDEQQDDYSYYNL